jgi:hypothetical protein
MVLEFYGRRPLQVSRRTGFFPEDRLNVGAQTAIAQAIC